MFGHMAAESTEFLDIGYYGRTNGGDHQELLKYFEKFVIGMKG